ncbi:MAG: hypothetical protein ACFFB3_02370 [Candidatus Hodarchaeota archaeon]
MNSSFCSLEADFLVQLDRGIIFSGDAQEDFCNTRYQQVFSVKLQDKQQLGFWT